MINNFKLIKDLKPGSVFLVEDKKGNRFVLKKTPNAKILVEISNLVHETETDLAQVMPEFYSQDDWFWEKYFEGELSGDTVENYGIKSDSFQYIDAEKLGKAIGELQSLEVGSGKLEVRSADFYLKNIEEFRPALTHEFDEKFAKKVEQFLLSKKDLVDKYSCFLSNGDLHPQNIMCKPLMIIDWDLLHFNNPGWDLADLYCWGWRDEEWGEKLIMEYRNFRRPHPGPLLQGEGNLFDQIFAFDVVYLSSQLIKHVKIMNGPKEFLEGQKKIIIRSLDN